MARMKVGRHENRADRAGSGMWDPVFGPVWGMADVVKAALQDYSRKPEDVRDLRDAIVITTAGPKR